MFVEMSNLENQVQEQFNRLQFTNDFIAKIETRLKIVYEEKKSSVTDEKSRIMQAKLSVESKLERAEHKLIDGVIDDQSFDREYSRCMDTGFGSRKPWSPTYSPNAEAILAYVEMKKPRTKLYEA